MLDPKLVEALAVGGATIGSLALIASFCVDWALNRLTDTVNTNVEIANENTQLFKKEFARLERTDDNQTKRLNDGFSLVNGLRRDVAIVKERQSAQSELSGVVIHNLKTLTDLYLGLLANGTFQPIEPPKRKKLMAAMPKRRRRKVSTR